MYQANEGELRDPDILGSGFVAPKGLGAVVVGHVMLAEDAEGCEAADAIEVGCCWQFSCFGVWGGFEVPDEGGN